MKQGMRWGRAGAFALAAVVLIAVLLAAQFSQQSQPTLLDLYNLLLTEEGENRLTLLSDRLDAIEEKIDDIDVEVDLVHTVAVKMLDDQYGFFATHEWTLEDMKFLLEEIDRQLDTIEEFVTP